MINKIKKIVSNFWLLFILKIQPIIVYTPGRVGSMSLIIALQKAGVFSFKVELLDQESWGSVWFCKQFVVKPQRSAKIITLVRDPVEILQSLFFSKAGRGHLSLTKEEFLSADNTALQRVFLDEIVNGSFFNEYLNWFEIEFQKHLKFNVFDYPFDKKNKTSVISHPIYPTLILRTDLPNSAKDDAINNFLNLNKIPIKIDNLNTKAERTGSDRYLSFKENLEIPNDMLTKIYNTPYARHFLSPTEIELAIKKCS